MNAYAAEMSCIIQLLLRESSSKATTDLPIALGFQGESGGASR